MSQAVYFIGGYLASDPDINAWLRSARQQKPGVQFFGYPWTEGAASDGDGPVKGFKKNGRFDSVVSAINADGSDVIYVVGHSSGCAIANAVDAALKSTANIALVALDGFRPSDDQLDRPSTQVWGAICDGVQSRNYPGFDKGRRRIYTATGCKTMWALHFSLVNSNASDKTVHHVSQGYSNCQANLGFM